MEIGATVTIGPNRVWPALAGRIGTIVGFTASNQPCGITCQRKYARQRCGGHPIVAVGKRRFLLPTEALVAQGRGEAA